MKLIFTDLDGTLLDHDTYSFRAAERALSRLTELSVPLILCSSKTRGEIELICKKLGMKIPFIAENGGGIYFPKKFLPKVMEERLCMPSKEKGCLVIEMGAGREELRETFVGVREKIGANMRSFSDMSVEEVRQLTSLPENEAKLALERRFTEPFIISDGGASLIADIISEFTARGLTVVKGGRFYHLMGSISKGAAVNKVKDVFFQICGHEITAMGLGDSENDLSMLNAVEKPVIVRKWDGSWMEAEGTENFIRTQGIGPAGWNEAVLDFLRI